MYCKALKCVYFKLICIGTKCLWIRSYFVKHNNQESGHLFKNNQKTKNKTRQKKTAKATPEEFASDH